GGDVMNPQRFLCLLSMAGACLLLSSCGGSENPLSDPLKAKPDARLSGIWRMDEGGGRVEYYHVGQAGDKLPPGIMRAVWIVHNRNGTIERPVEMLVFSTTIGEKHYLNVLFPKDEDQDLAQFEEEGWKPDLIRG
ncbi:MAG: hypothetical protein K8R46_06795, partial [Pirellulales bacterium]|nr:hypothetical protein [Pirellulales bacterium]